MVFEIGKPIETEWQKILTIPSNNRFPPQLIMKLKAQMQQKTQTNTTKDENKQKMGYLYLSQLKNPENNQPL